MQQYFKDRGVMINTLRASSQKEKDKNGKERKGVGRKMERESKDYFFQKTEASEKKQRKTINLKAKT